MAVKRRVIWMDDEDWARLGQYAGDRKVTVSAAIRKAVLGDTVETYDERQHVRNGRMTDVGGGGGTYRAEMTVFPTPRRSNTGPGGS